MPYVNSNSFREKMIHDLMARGLSQRKAKQAFKAVFDVIADGLWRGEEVELPFGWLDVEPGDPRRQYLRRLSDLGPRRKLKPPKTKLVVRDRKYKKKIVLRRDKTFKWD